MVDDRDTDAIVLVNDAALVGLTLVRPGPGRLAFWPKGKASPEMIGRAAALKGRLLALLDCDLPAGPTACPICGAVGYGRGACASCCLRLGVTEALRLVAEDRARRPRRGP